MSFTTAFNDYFLYNYYPSTPLLVILFILTMVAVKIVKIFSWPEAPKVFLLWEEDKNSMLNVWHKCSQLQNLYVPPFLWGRNGHLQTAVYGILGHASLARSANKRHFVRLIGDPGTTVTFDVFEPSASHSSGGDFTLAICPGIANSSESNYIRTCVHHAKEAGFRCSVLNHLGALKDVKLTSSRIFVFGETEEYASMLMKLLSLYPRTKLILVGFSMGANIVTKYLGENTRLNHRILCGISVCQGYDAIKAVALLHQWDGFRRAYMYIMTENVKRLLRYHYDDVVLPYVKEGIVDEAKLFASTSLYMLDEYFTRRVRGFSTVDEYLLWCGSGRVIPQIRVPFIFINALDDPLIPYTLLEPVIKHCETYPNLMFILTKHGGHLGFLEGSSVSPLSVTWLDRLIVQLANGLIDTFWQANKSDHQPSEEVECYSY